MLLKYDRLMISQLHTDTNANSMEKTFILWSKILFIITYNLIIFINHIKNIYQILKILN